MRTATMLSFAACLGTAVLVSACGAARAPGSPDADGPPDGDVSDTGPTEGSVGAACERAEDCSGGVVPAECLRMLWALEMPGGYCTALICARDAECPGGDALAACVDVLPGLPACLDRCDPPVDPCRDGYRCIDPDGGGPSPRVCLPFCERDEDCPAGQTCAADRLPPLCHRLAAEQNGAACRSHADCRPGSWCFAETATYGGFPGGMCTQFCLRDGDCANGGACVVSCGNQDGRQGNDCDDDGVPGLDEDAQGLCMQACSPVEPRDCQRTGYTCRELGHIPERRAHACGPDCAEEGGGCTTPGWTCDPSGGVVWGAGYGIGRCQPPFQASQLGAACSLSSGCAGGFCIDEAFSGYPGGMCVEECLGGPGSPDSCPGGAICAAGPGEPSICLRTCVEGTDDCREGLGCQEMLGVFWVCMPDCTANDQCGYGCCNRDGSGFCDPTRRNCL